ncbi:two-component system sensor histidine kinase NtrB [Actinoplanes solisilvae]|uniref:two-component system sensor histidine kinase NtrB n=1 Tax=Actinoplanes solisilvae TaxID=2486853 RepID=UPI0013E3B764|nr:ATP-binding protein [Actinoplanes solisilvae]
MLGQVRSLFLLFCVLWSVIGVFGVKQDAGLGTRVATIAAIVVVELCLCWGYRRGAFPRALWLVEASCVCVVAAASDYGITVGLLFVWINFRALYGGRLDHILGASCVVGIMGIGVGLDGLALSDALPLTVTALIGHTINHTLGRGIGARDRAALRERVVAEAGASFAAATDRGEAARAAVDAVVALDRRISAAVVATIAGGKLRPIESAGVGGRDPNDRTMDLATSGPAHQAALRPGGYAQITGTDATSFAERLGLPASDRVDLVPLAAGGKVFGLLVVAYCPRPEDDLSASLSTLADEVALTLDQLLTRSRLNVVVEHSHDALLLCGEQGTIRFANSAAARLLDVPREALTGRELDSLVHPDDLAEVLAPDQTTAQIRRLRGPDPEAWNEFEVFVAYVTEHNGSRSIVLNARDISERQRLELGLRHAQKLESVGRLAAGIAHEINTPMQFIGDNVRFLDESFTELLTLTAEIRERLGASDEDLTRRMLDLDLDFLLEEAPAAIRQTLEGVERVAMIVRAMKAFGHPGSDTKSPADLNEAIQNAVVVAANEIRLVAEVRTDLAELPPVLCHIGDINQTVLNLLINAAHAIDAAGRGRGEIRVSTRREGHEVVIEVADTGTGVPPEIADKLFDPFFTTKQVGQGTGQGLPLIRSLVVDRHQGSISFTSEPGVGTIFTVRLPVDARYAPESPATPAEVPV